MIRGVCFQIPQTTSNLLWQIFSCIDVEKYFWYNVDSQNEVWDRPCGKQFFETEFYDGKSFLNHINSNYYIIFLKLQAYCSNNIYSDIHTYEEFVKSDCQILLLIYDCENVEIYVKDNGVATAIYKNALVCNFADVQYITEENDSRTKLDVL